MRRDGWIWIVLILAAALLMVLGATGLRLWNEQGSAPLAAEGLPAGDTRASEVPTANLPLAKLTAPGSGGPAWQEAPDCASQPLDAAGWAQDGEAARGGLLAPGFGAAQAEMAAPGSPAAAYQALKLNIASGRLNRATGIQLKDFPEIQTVGDLLAYLEGSQGESLKGGAPESEAAGMALRSDGPDPAYNAALEAVLSGEAITRPVCARVMLLAGGRPAQVVDWSGEPVTAGGLRRADAVGSMAAASTGESEMLGLATVNPRQSSLDWGMASPDGRWAAYTSMGMDEGGPVLVQNLGSGAWINLIALINKTRGAEQPELNESDWWTVIDWFPDCRRLMIARSDASATLVVDIESGAWQAYPFAGEGNGGTYVLDLAPDGSRFVFLGFDADGSQTINLVDLTSGETTNLLTSPTTTGFRSFPRFSPDGSSLAVLLQRGNPQDGLSYSIEQISLADGAVRELVPGNTGLTVPTWSPDGTYLAFTRPSSGTEQRVVEGQAPVMESVNVWVVHVADGALTQVTALSGQARSPQWSFDSRTLAFISEDGQVGLAQVDTPGQMWAVSSAPADFPLLSGVFFVP